MRRPLACVVVLLLVFSIGAGAAARTELVGFRRNSTFTKEEESRVRSDRGPSRLQGITADGGRVVVWRAVSRKDYGQW